MKKILALILATFMLLSFVACSNSNSHTDHNDHEVPGSSDDTDAGNTHNPSEGTNNDTQNSGNNERQKINMSDITAASSFSEGKAFVCLNGDMTITYCIDEKGYVLFKLNETTANEVMGVIGSEFHHGMAHISYGDANYFCDEKGNVTKPADVGVTAFFSVALEQGYVIAEIVEATFDSTKKTMGIMNTSFEWVVQPTEELHEALSINGDPYIMNAINAEDYYEIRGDYLFVSFGDTRYIKLTDGTVTEADPKEFWVNKTDVFDAVSQKYENCSGVEFDYPSMSAAVVFTNFDAHKVYLSVISINAEKGTLEFDFDPMAVFDFSGGVTIDDICYDGEYVVVSLKESDGQIIKVFDKTGKEMGSLDAKAVLNSTRCNIDYSDEIILIDYGSKRYYTNIELKQLF